MSAEIKKAIQLEIGHVLFIDIVGYSKLLINEQSERLQKLKEIVWGTEQFRLAQAEDKLLRLPTGDGGALVFRNNPEAPVLCAMEISKELKRHPELQVRMGIHSGPVNEITDLNAQANIAGAGINIAQRIMDCGDAGHILLSKHVADDLEQYPQWRSHLHDLGECEVKHDVRVNVVNLYTDEVGNPELPEKFKLPDVKAPVPAAKEASPKSAIPKWAMTGAVVALVVMGFLLWSKRTPTISAASEKSIAVLPFENLSDEKQNAYFTDGVQDEILTDLSKIADLKVISRTSVMQYKSGLARNLRKIGEELGVAHVVEGSVQRAANKIRVNAQLIDARNDAHLWAQTYDRDLADVFAIQSEIAQTIAEQLKARLSPSEKAAIAQAPTTDVKANDLYLQALALDQTVNDPNAKQNLLQAIRLVEEASRRDPNFLRAHLLLCEINLDLYWYGFDHTTARRERARIALENAERIQPDSGEVHLAKGIFAYHGFRDYEGARSEYELARQTLPNSGALYLNIAAVDRRQARWDDTIRNFDRAVELDPRNFIVLQEASFTYTALGRYAEATNLAKRAIEVSPKAYFVRVQPSWISYFEKADAHPLRAELNELLKEGPEATANASQFFVQCALAERDPAKAAQGVAFVPPEGTVDPATNFIMRREWFAGLVARTFGDAAGAQRAFTAARAAAAKTVQEQPDYAPAWSLLGMIDAGLGHKENAITEGKRACELLPLSKDSWEGPVYVMDLALIYTWLGEKDLALEQLAIDAKAPGGITYGRLKLEPMWDPLRGDPRFEKIVASLAPKQ